MGITRTKFYAWQNRYGQANKHNANVPKKHWTTPEEIKAVEDYARTKIPIGSYHLKDGYRRLTYQMLDENIVALSPATVYRILKNADLLNRWNTSKNSSKGTGFIQPESAHQQWHTDIKYVNFKGTFLFLISVMDGFSRYILHHELRMNMTEIDVEYTIQRALEKYPGHSSRLISDNGSQYISKDFKDFLKNTELTHIRTSVNYPQSNGKIERFHRSFGEECLKKKSMINLSDARKQVADYIDIYNKSRLHASLYFLTPEDFLSGKVNEKLNIREQKLIEAQNNRKEYWKNKENLDRA